MGEMSPDQENAAKAESGWVLTTLAELGSNLPVGFTSPQGRVRPFRCRPFRMKEERSLAKMKDEGKGSTLGKFVADVLATMIQTIGPHNFDAMKPNDKMVLLSQMTTADVLYMYMYLRYDAMGPDSPVEMNVKCVKCSTQHIWRGDLGSLEVRKVPDDIPSMDYQYKLRDPIAVRGKPRDTLVLSPMNWSVFMRPEYNDAGKRETQAVLGSIVGIDGIDAPRGTFRLADAELEEMTKYDLSGIKAQIEERTPGPQMVVRPICPACGFEMAMMLDWGYDSFFSRSAQRTPGRT